MLRSGKIRGNLDLDSSGPPERAKTAHPVENSILLQFLLAHTLLPFLLQVDKSPYVSTSLTPIITVPSLALIIPQ